MTNSPLLFRPVKRGWLYQHLNPGVSSAGEVFRLNPFLKPHTNKSRGWLACPLYVNCYPDSSSIAAKNAMVSEQRQMFVKGGVVNVAGSTDLDPKNEYLSEFLRNSFPEFFPKGLATRDVSETQWEIVLLIVNGAAVTALREAFGAFDLRAAYAQVTGGVRGAKYPSSAAMCREMTTKQVSAILFNYPRLACIKVDPDIPVVAAGTPATATVAPADHDPMADVDIIAAASPDASFDASFDADSMTHGQIIDLARKGHDAAVALADRDRAVSAAVDLATTATAERDTAIEERDAAEKRAKMVAPVATPITDNGDGTIEILGVNLPTWSGGHGPAAKPGYDLSAWQAVMQVADFKVEANAAQVAKTILDGESVRLVGPPSVGKTSGISEIAAATGA